MRLEGKTVLLTGATGGLGRATAVALAERGAALVLSSRKAEDLDELVAGLPGEGHRAIVSDLAEDGAALRLLEAAGDLDVLVANAGLPASGRLEGFSQEQIGRALRVNLESPVRMTRELLPAWQERRSGHFVFVSSISGFVSTPRASLYAATKFGLRGFALNLREDLRRSGIGVSVITPGAIREAGMFADSGVKLPRGVGTRKPEDVASAVISGIEKNRAEIDVAPFSLSSGARAFGLAPSLVAAVNRRLGANPLATAIAEGQRDKR